MLPAIELQAQGDAFYFIADYHSMTSLFDPAQRRQNTLDVALDFLACGLDPKKYVFFRQSDVPQVTELAWLLTTLTPMGLLERCHSYKDKVAKGVSANHGLFAYPVLMAADILLYDSNVVPVGRDQKQHVEVTRDIAIKFNEAYGPTFVIPEPRIREEVAVVPGTATFVVGPVVLTVIRFVPADCEYAALTISGAFTSSVFAPTICALVTLVGAVICLTGTV